MITVIPSNILAAIMLCKSTLITSYLLDVSKATKIGWTYRTEFEEGIRLAYEDFLNNPMRAER